ncbi:hypothetical protein SB5544_01382 [Klebsiella variicola]|nr:hypothetical protein SB5544_01382 [Klebsiella variicola]
MSNVHILIIKALYLIAPFPIASFFHTFRKPNRAPANNPTLSVRIEEQNLLIRSRKTIHNGNHI